MTPPTRFDDFQCKSEGPADDNCCHSEGRSTVEISWYALQIRTFAQEIATPSARNDSCLVSWSFCIGVFDDGRGSVGS